MKKALLLLSLFICSFLIFGQTSFVSVKGVMIDNFNAQAGLRKVQFDSKGNMYVIGYYYDKVDVDMGKDTVDLFNYQDYSFFLAKYDANDNYKWSISFSEGVTQSGLDFPAMTIDKMDNVYLTGKFISTTDDFDPGPGIKNLTSNGGNDAFIAKYYPSGKIAWVKNVGGTGDDIGADIKTDEDLNVYVGGTGFGQAFFTKYDSIGNLLWLKKIGTISNPIYTISVNKKMELVVGGGFYGTVDFDPGAGVKSYTATSLNLFLAKYDSLGNYIWANQLKGDFSPELSMGMDTSSNIYITGEVGSTADFDPGAGYGGFANKGSYDVFIAKYNTSGTYTWVKGFGGTATEYGRNIYVSSKRLHVAGAFGNTVDFDAGTGVKNITAVDNHSGFFVTYDLNGNFVQATPIDGSDYETCYGVAESYNGDIVVVGEAPDFSSTLPDFDPGAPVVNLKGSYYQGIEGFVARYNVITDVNEISSTNPFKIFPNPTHDQLHIESLNQQTVLAITIYDVMGRKILSINKEEMNETISLTAIKNPGTYFVNIITKESAFTKALIIE